MKIGRIALWATATAVAGFVLSWNGSLTPDQRGSIVSQAEAVIGRPLTPVSYAGVARRTVRRCAAGVYC
jgi:hypothetical protein